MPVGERLFKAGIFLLSLSVASMLISGCGTAGANVGQAAVAAPQTWTISGTLNPASSTAGTTVAKAGSAYFYVVTAVDSSGNESAFSNQVQAVIPTP